MLGKSVIGVYIGKSMVASGYGAGGALVALLVWVYYSAQIFLLGAEFTSAYAGSRASGGRRTPDVNRVLDQRDASGRQVPLAR
jgi:membrane protein